MIKGQMPLFIHTLGRVNQQITWSQFPKSLHKRTFFVVQAHEEKQWLKRPNVLVLPPRIKTLSPTRQWILEYAALNNLDRICMMDDDLKFQIRDKKDDKFVLTNIQGKQVEDAFNLLEEALSGRFLHAGIGTREYSNNVPVWERICCAMLRVLAYRPVEVLRLGCRFDRVGVRQDLDMTLQLIRKGYPNCVTYHYTQSHNHSNAEGGCSTYRTPEFVDKELAKFCELNKPFVSYTDRGKDRAAGPKVIIQWQQAFASAKKKGFF